MGVPPPSNRPEVDLGRKPVKVPKHRVHDALRGRRKRPHFNPGAHVGPHEHAPRDKEYNGNRFETIGSAQFSERHRDNLEDHTSYTDATPNPVTRTAFSAFHLAPFKDWLFGIKNIHPGPDQVDEHTLEHLNFGAETYTAVGPSLTTDPDKRTYDRDLHFDPLRHGGMVQSVPTSKQEPAVDVAINKNRFARLGVPLLYEN